MFTRDPGQFMLRRLVVLIFILTVAGQASVGVCGCLRTVDRHACCEKQTSDVTLISTSGCCGQDGLKITNDSLLQYRTENSTRIFSELGLQPSYLARDFCALSTTFSAQFLPPSSSGQFEYEPARDLYLRNHTFRI